MVATDTGVDNFSIFQKKLAFMTEGTSKEEEEVIVAQWRIVWLTFKCTTVEILLETCKHDSYFV